MLNKDNVLVLDEPTNHLDLESIARSPRGCSATRGRSSSSRTTRSSSARWRTRIWALHQGEPVLDFPGTFDEFVEKHPDLAAAHV